VHLGECDECSCAEDEYGVCCVSVSFACYSPELVDEFGDCEGCDCEEGCEREEYIYVWEESGDSCYCCEVEDFLVREVGGD